MWYTFCRHLHALRFRRRNWPRLGSLLHLYILFVGCLICFFEFLQKCKIPIRCLSRIIIILILSISLRHTQSIRNGYAWLGCMLCNGISGGSKETTLPGVLRHLTGISWAIIRLIYLCLTLGASLWHDLLHHNIGNQPRLQFIRLAILLCQQAVLRLDL